VVAVEATFTGDDASDRFGPGVALSGDTALVPTSDAAYVFVRAGTSWSRQAKLTVPDDPDGDVMLRMAELGAVSGDTAVVGVNHVQRGEVSGSVYVYTRSGTSWSLQAKLPAPAGEPTAEFLFARSLAIEGDTLAVGGEGVAYIFTRTGTSWTIEARLSGDDGSPSFGASVGVDGTTAVVGDPWRNRVYVFNRSGSDWSRQALLTSKRTEEGDEFGDAVFVSGDTALIGAGGDDVGDDWDIGSSYAFVRSGADWVEQQYFRGRGDASGLSGDIAVLGSGCVELYSRSGTTWSPTPRRFRTVGRIGVALDDTTLLLATCSEPGTTDEARYTVMAARLVKDPIPPAVTAYPTSVQRGRIARILYRVDDATEPPSPYDPDIWDWVYAVVDVFQGSKSVQRLYDGAPCNVDWIADFRCNLPKGRYTVKIAATDLAGNAQSRIGRATLTVR
jgi:hypothetical protein